MVLDTSSDMSHQRDMDKTLCLWNKNPDCGEHWELKQVQSGTYIFTVPGTGLVLGVRDGIVRLEFARGLPTQEWLITRGPLQGIVHDVP
ncbi:uncharacterized protein EI90DRAFT_3067160 [Cantharellus anzutake]|uniref:uncharacterized protein n=1 Tax=Cantharellus anzutake TaxID=1750568 RepID=UPI001903CAAA|nr:uncharacterized protein EI90DRAFT_3067160 [Cantharellus anzutake]KAF8327541.1 hypothetical protein EI90DRAFT_3067160 [Cantharellus anzutake]